MPDVIGGSLIGQPLDRVDGRLKVTGQATYSAEHNIPNLVHAVLVTSAIAKGRIAAIQTDSARRAPGVLAILTHEDRLKLAKDPMDVEGGSPVDRKLQLLQSDRVNYANQPIAVAVAETLEAAQEAAGLVEVRYSAEIPSVTMQKSLPTMYAPERVSGAGDPASSRRGDAKTALAQAEVKVEQEYTTPFQNHNPMEPHATIAVWDGAVGHGTAKLTLYDASQGIFGDRKRIADLLGLQPDDVRVVSLYVGGGFGSKGPTWSHVALCAMAAREVKRPVKLVLARPQMFGPIGCRSETHQAIAVGAKRDGTLVALTNDTITHTSSFDEFTEPAALPARMLYAVPNNSTSQRLVRSDIGTPSYMRAPGETPGTFALEVAMDELAYQLNMDPVELRLKNYAEQDPNKGLPWSSKSLRECYRSGAERFGWAQRKMAPRSMRDGNTLIGWGMGTALYPARRSKASALARLQADGTILVEAGSQELGTGTYTIMTQIAADVLGVPPALVDFRLGDTRYPETPVSGGSQTAASTGSAVYQAAQDLRGLMVQTAIHDSESPVFGAKVDDVTIEDGKIFKSGQPGWMQTLRSLVERSGQPYLEARSDTKPGDEETMFSSYSFGVQFAEVRVDADLGQMKVSRMVGVFGPGRILNAKTARSQFLGGMVWGVSCALYEHTVYDERSGRIVNNNLAEYHVPTNADIGSLEAYWVDETDDRVSLMGAKGIGEIGITGAAAAIANAVFHATGKRLRNLPITLDQLL